MLIDRVSAMSEIAAKANTDRLVSLADVRDALNSLEGIDPATLAPRWRDANNRIMELMNAEAEGRLVVLPCKVGDTVYMPYKGRAHKLRVQGISVSISGNDVVLHFGGYPVANVWGSEVGRTVFLTKEEAEQALKGAVDVF